MKIKTECRTCGSKFKVHSKKKQAKGCFKIWRKHHEKVCERMAL